MATMGISAAAGPIMLAWIGKGLTEQPSDGNYGGDLPSILQALESAGHSTAGFGQVVAAYMAAHKKLSVKDIEGIISDVAYAFDLTEAK